MAGMMVMKGGRWVPWETVRNTYVSNAGPGLGLMFEASAYRKGTNTYPMNVTAWIDHMLVGPTGRWSPVWGLELKWSWDLETSAEVFELNKTGTALCVTYVRTLGANDHPEMELLRSASPFQSGNTLNFWVPPYASRDTNSWKTSNTNRASMTYPTTTPLQVVSSDTHPDLVSLKFDSAWYNLRSNNTSGTNIPVDIWELGYYCELGTLDHMKGPSAFRLHVNPSEYYVRAFDWVTYDAFGKPYNLT